jgi:hypothetical protein
MDKDKEHMRFLAACFALVNCGKPKDAVRMADELLEELSGNQSTGGIVDIVAKRKRTKS